MSDKPQFVEFYPGAGLDKLKLVEDQSIHNRANFPVKLALSSLISADAARSIHPQHRLPNEKVSHNFFYLRVCRQTLPKL